jgi:hypothetical protein
MVIMPADNIIFAGRRFLRNAVVDNQ